MKKTEISNAPNAGNTFECRLGRIDYAPDRVLSFAEGIYGFEHESRYVLWDDERFLPFRWLISENNPDIMFPVLDPRLIVPEFAPPWDDPNMDSILAIVTLGGSDPVTMNLRAPILFSSKTRTGKQAILADGDYPLHYPVSR
jgi:flagellar assembly factor FliW